MTTSTTRVFRTTAEKGVGFIDAPVSGGQAGAENGVLTVMCGGGKSHFKKLTVIDVSLKTLISDRDRVNLPMVNQVCIAGLVQGLEGVNFGLKAGLDMDKHRHDSKGAAGCGKW